MSQEEGERQGLDRSRVLVVVVVVIDVQVETEQVIRHPAYGEQDRQQDQ